MNFTKYILLTLAVIFVGALQAQLVPGYRGKRNIIYYQDNMSLSLYEPTYLNKVANGEAYTKAEESSFVPINNTHSISYERVVKRRFSLGLSYALAASKTYVELKGSVPNPTNSPNIYFDVSDIKTNMFAHYINGAFIFYGKKAPAPLGLYFKISMGMCLIKGKLLDFNGYTTAPTSTTVPSTIYTLNYDKGYFGVNRFNMGFTLGTNRIYGDRWVVKRGMSLNFLFKSYENDTYTDAYNKIQSRAFNHDIFTFFLGVGYLL